MNKLAIVIPAYKIDYFQWVLESFSKQTNKNFNVYIGIDASKSDFESIIEKYKGLFNITYKRFEENLGGKDLVAQWNRCLNLIQDEEWIWLFSDDDIIENNCVELFYNELAKRENFDLFHFDVEIINAQNEVIKRTKSYPEKLNAVSFLKKKNTANLDSFVVEYIFKRSIFEEIGGFQHFDMAWGTDIATWAKLGKEKGIKTIRGAKVLWRQSNLNITPTKDKPILIRKLLANVCYFNWCKEYFQEITYLDIYYYMFRMLFHYSPYLKSNDFNDIVKPFYYSSYMGRIYLKIIKVLYPIMPYFHKIIHKFK